MHDSVGMRQDVRICRRFADCRFFCSTRIDRIVLRLKGLILLQAYLPVLVFLGVALVIGLVMLAIGLVLGRSDTDPEKLSPYECGFEPFEDSRMKFDVRYYLVAILFIIFDLEIAFLFPWAVALDAIGLTGIVAMGIFLIVLVVGFVYEWKRGALEWD